jgi:murein DD-endopeptidase MepM/ murein hydrolase activator NlpD
MAAMLLGSAAGPTVAAGPPQFTMPLACRYGETCFIQNYVDRDPGPGRIDYACGRLTYDGDGGVDFRLRDFVEMAEGYEVLAAAPGVVQAVRDGMRDVSIRETGPEAVRGREAGNGVVIDHGEGWTTQYSHMRQGSVRVRPGERVAAGQTLGLVGLSGRTEFPHVEFKVRHAGAEVDPFVGEAHSQPCGDPRSPMWTPEVAESLVYIPTGLLVAAFAGGAPDPEPARRGAFRLGQWADDPEALVLWADLFGVQAGDLELFRIVGPAGAVLLDTRKPVAESRVSWFTFGGLRRPRAGWIPGRYEGSYELQREGETIARTLVAIEITR